MGCFRGIPPQGSSVSTSIFNPSAPAPSNLRRAADEHNYAVRRRVIRGTASAVAAHGLYGDAMDEEQYVAPIGSHASLVLVAQAQGSSRVGADARAGAPAPAAGTQAPGQRRPSTNRAGYPIRGTALVPQNDIKFRGWSGAKTGGYSALKGRSVGQHGFTAKMGKFCHFCR